MPTHTDLGDGLGLPIPEHVGRIVADMKTNMDATAREWCVIGFRHGILKANDLIGSHLSHDQQLALLGLAERTTATAACEKEFA